MMTRLLPILLALLATASLHGQSGRIYTQTSGADPGGITGTFPSPLSHAIAIERDRTRVFLADLGDGGKRFTFAHLPVGRYDLILVARDGVLYEGLDLGTSAAAMAPTPAAHLTERIAKADAFFNRHVVHRIGLEEDHAFALVERLRDRETLAQSGAVVDADIRRLEIIDLQRADDDWQMIGSRHIYREAEPKRPQPPFFKDVFLSGLGNLRVIDTMKDLGPISPPTP